MQAASKCFYLPTDGDRLIPNIIQWITESSARMYRLLVENGKSPYSTDGDEQLDVVKNVKGFTDAGGLAAIPRVPGVWNLPVCDMGPHVDWNSKK